MDLESGKAQLDESDELDNPFGIETASSDEAAAAESAFQIDRRAVLALGGAALVAALAVLRVGARQHLALLAVFATCAAALAAAYNMVRGILAANSGSRAMRQVSGPILRGAEAFFQTQYTAIARISAVVALALALLFLLRPASFGIAPLAMALLVACSFLLGAACSAFAGFVGLWVAVRTNVRVAAAAGESYNRAIQLALRGGACSGLAVVATCTIGLTSLYSILTVLMEPLGLASAQIPPLMIGYTFGASFVALFAQLGGGIYTKAADVGADLVGKIEADIPEDDPRNPAVIADLVGDNVGDCAGRGADLFESIAAEILGAMIIGSQLATDANMVDPHGFLFFPLAVHALDCVVSTLGVYVVRTDSKLASAAERPLDGDGESEAELERAASRLEDPLDILKRGFYVALGLSAIGMAGLCYALLDVPSSPNAWWHFLLCAYVGMVSALINLFTAQYYTDYKYGPVREIAQASTTGDATNVIAGLSVGMRSTAVPILTVSIGLLLSHALGEAALEGGGLFGTAVATMGMLSTGVFVLAADSYGPICDNAGGIVEMSGQPARVRMLTDRLDGSGNVTKAATKGYAVGSAGLAAFLLFSAFTDVVVEYSNKAMPPIDFARPEVFVGGLLGAALVFVFSGLTIKAVGDAAGSVVVEVRRQFKERPGILTGRELPDYGGCVRIVTEAALSEMVLPGMLATTAPALVGFLFKWIGQLSDQEQLGPVVVAAFLMSATISGLALGTVLNNSGGAWDNAKKYIEMGAHGGKNSVAHKASVTGDTVGDPCKDTSGPALHVLIKLIATVSLVLGPMFVDH